MTLSSNSVFHFTTSIDVIKNILSDKFYGSYCKEVLHHKNEVVSTFIPMICFCDIRLETVAKLPAYGKYGIGLSKEWAIRNKLNPVFYLEKESFVAESFTASLFGAYASVKIDGNEVNTISHKVEEIKRLPRPENVKEAMLANLRKRLNVLSLKAKALEHIIYSMYYTKHYQADLERDNGVIKNYRFYDEREWRYMPQFQCAVCELKRTEQEYIAWRATREHKPLLNEVQLSFLFSDIEHIIVEKTSEIPEMINFIKGLSEDKCNADIKDNLLTNITSFEKIENDY